ncbi:MAG: hypothetical protein R3F37_04945 [Candidatus Competibacteraceae bacterium]
MVTAISVGSPVGDCEITALFREDAAYQWAKARDCNNDRPVLLQLLHRHYPTEDIDGLVEYFKRLQTLDGQGLWVPEQLFADTASPLILCYPYLSGNSLERQLEQTPDRAQHWFRQAAERLSTLHDNHLAHGWITPDSWLVCEERLYLLGFGYGPLLTAGHSEVMRDCGDWLAPEVTAGRGVTPTTDCYGFARTLRYWLPKLKFSDWYRRATAINPTHRFRHMREATESLETLLNHPKAVVPTFGEASRFETVGESQSTELSGGLLAKHQLEIRAESGGSVTGGEGSIFRIKP